MVLIPPQSVEEYVHIYCFNLLADITDYFQSARLCRPRPVCSHSLTKECLITHVQMLGLIMELLGVLLRSDREILKRYIMMICLSRLMLMEWLCRTPGKIVKMAVLEQVRLKLILVALDFFCFVS